MALPDANPWFRSLTTLMRAGQEAWLEYGRLYRPVRDRPRPSPEPAWTTPHAVRLDLPTMRLRGFSTGDASGRATILVAPFALHQATIADFAPGHSIVETLVAAGVSPLFVVQCKSATATMPFVSIDDYLAGLNVCVDEVGGRVNLVGLCQGGWLSLAYAARFPDKVGRLALVGSPVDLDAAPSGIVESVRTYGLGVFEDIVRAGEGRVLGQSALAHWGVTDLDRPAVCEVLQRVDPRPELLDRFAAWHRATVDLPGTFYLECVQRLFGRNELARGRFEALGRVVDPRSLRMPLYLLAAEDDEVTPPDQLLGTARLVGTPPAEIVTATCPGSHLSLYLGARTLACEWGRIGAWLAAPDAQPVPAAQLPPASECASHAA